MSSHMKSFEQKVEILEKDDKTLQKNHKAQHPRHIHALIKAAKAVRNSGYKHFVKVRDKVQGL